MFSVLLIIRKSPGYAGQESFGSRLLGQNVLQEMYEKNENVVQKISLALLKDGGCQHAGVHGILVSYYSLIIRQLTKQCAQCCPKVKTPNITFVNHFNLNNACVINKESIYFIRGPFHTIMKSPSQLCQIVVDAQ